MVFVVTGAHRFLHQRDPGSPSFPQHTVLQGFGVSDIVFHDLYHGCVSVGRSVELWARQEWADDPNLPVVVVRLTDAGELDFSGNPDTEVAQAVFDAARLPRPRRYGPRKGVRGAATEATSQGTERLSDEDAERLSEEDAAAARADGQRSSDRVGSALGSGQGLVNRMNQIAAAIEAQRGARFLVVVDDLGAQFEALLVTGQNAVCSDAQRVLRRRWLNANNPTGVLVVYLDPDRKLSGSLDRGIPGVGWWEIEGPDEREIGEALHRVDARVPLGFSEAGNSPSGVVRALTRHGNLRAALRTAARVIQKDGRLTLMGVLDLPPVDLEAAANVLAELDQLVGLDELKARVRAMTEVASKRRERLETDGIYPDETLHIVLHGNPGTGKTTVAKILGRLFHALGVLPTADFTEVKPAEVKSEFDGETRSRMQSILSSAIGGVLFIDEAQQFGGREDRKSREAVEALVPMSWNHRHELVVILAGYASGMTDLMAMDQGLSRRFPKDQWFEFHDYNDDQLWEILLGNLRGRGLHLHPEAEPALRPLLLARASRGGFGNAGGVDNLVKSIQDRHDARTGTDDPVVTTEDLPPRVERRPADLEAALEKLNAMTGLGAVKASLRRLHAGLEFDDLEQEDVPDAPRFRFVGPPGTGKTTVAGLIGELLYGMGLLNRKIVVSVTGASLKAGFVGQTTGVVRKLFDDARGGVLFIDEAHGLDSTDSFAADALRTLVSELTLPENRDTVVVMAGYKPEVDHLLLVERGLEERFPIELVFEHLGADECVEVASRVLERGRVPFTADPEFFEVLAERARQAASSPTFGNARWVGNRITDAKQALKHRVMSDADAYDATTRRHLIAVDLGDARHEPASSQPTPLRRISNPSVEPAAPELPAAQVVADEDVASAVPRLTDSVVQLIVTTVNGEATGTAFVATADHVLVTNRHVVIDAHSIEVLLGPSRGSVPGRVLAVDENCDLALVAFTLEDDVAPLRPLPLGESRMLPHLRELVVVGFGQVDPGESSRVVVARVGRNQALDDQSFETDGAIEEGFSGGPLWDPTQGGVVGVVVGGRGRGVKIAIRAENARVLLEGVGYRTEVG